MVRFREAARKIIRKYSLVEGLEAYDQNRYGTPLPMVMQHKTNTGTPVETLPMIRSESEKEKIVEPLLGTKTGSTLKQVTRIGKSFMIKGEIAGSEDLAIDGRVVGKVDFKDHELVIGPGGIVHAEIQAKNVVVEGKLVGNISAGGMVTIQSTGSLVGGITAARIAINEGAHFKGTVDITSAKDQSAKE